MVAIEITCPFCGDTYEVLVYEEDWLAYQDGELAQNAFPYLSATDRESIISGICPTCQARVFGE